MPCAFCICGAKIAVSSISINCMDDYAGDDDDTYSVRAALAARPSDMEFETCCRVPRDRSDVEQYPLLHLFNHHRCCPPDNTRTLQATVACLMTGALGSSDPLPSAPEELTASNCSLLRGLLPFQRSHDTIISGQGSDRGAVRVDPDSGEDATSNAIHDRVWVEQSKGTWSEPLVIATCLDDTSGLTMFTLNEESGIRFAAPIPLHTCTLRLAPKKKRCVLVVFFRV